MGALIIIPIVAIIALVAWWAWQQKKKRRADLATFATQYGLQYQADDPFGLLGYGFRLFSKGDGRGCENVMWGEWQGLPIQEADYWYYEQSTDSKGNTSRNYSYFSVVVGTLPLDMPWVTIERENVFTRFADHLGFHDLDFESEEFNRRYQVKAKDRAFAYKLVDARMIRWLESSGGAFGFEVSGPNLLVFCKRLKPFELVPLFGTAKAFPEHIPRLVWNEYGVGAAPPGPGAAAEP
jgi:hypothetical protein